MCNGDDDNLEIIRKGIIHSCYLAQNKRHQKYYPLKFVLCNPSIPLIVVLHELKIH